MRIPDFIYLSIYLCVNVRVVGVVELLLLLLMERTLSESEWTSMSHCIKLMINAFHRRSTRCIPHLICMDWCGSLSILGILLNGEFSTRLFNILYPKAIFDISASNGIEIVGRFMRISNIYRFVCFCFFIRIAIFYHLVIEFSWCRL